LPFPATHTLPLTPALPSRPPPGKVSKVPQTPDGQFPPPCHTMCHTLHSDQVGLTHLPPPCHTFFGQSSPLCHTDGQDVCLKVPGQVVLPATMPQEHFGKHIATERGKQGKVPLKKGQSWEEKGLLSGFPNFCKWSMQRSKKGWNATAKFGQSLDPP
jgi:hypothetical protein